MREADRRDGAFASLNPIPAEVVHDKPSACQSSQERPNVTIENLPRIARHEGIGATERKLNPERARADVDRAAARTAPGSMQRAGIERPERRVTLARASQDERGICREARVERFA